MKVIPRAGHILSRLDIDPDALRVLTRLHENEYAAYLVGGSVRDLLLSRRPKDFDIGTDAHPYEIKKLFRNCWIIGRRFRLAHVKFGLKTIEVATFRKHVPAEDAASEAAAADAANAEAEASNPDPEGSNEPVVVHSDEGRRRRRGHHDEHGIVRRDNVYGTPEEDAFRRDFTVNALFYDIATKSVIDYTGGLDDLHHKRIVSIGDPAVRFTEDPVRMLRAAVFAARLGFSLDDAVESAIASHGGLILKASPARLLEEYFKILRSGHAEATFRELHRVGLLQLMTPDLKDPPQAMWTALTRLDMYRRMHDSLPVDLVNPILAGALLVPMGLLQAEEDQLNFGMLTLPRKDIDRLRHVLTMVPKLTDPNLPPRLLRGLPGRPSFHDAVTWLEIFGDAPEAVAHWKEVKARTPVPKAEPRRRGGRGGAARGGHGAHLKDPSLEPHGKAPEHPRHQQHPPNQAHPTVTDGPRKRRRRGRRRGGGGGPGGPPPSA